MEVLAAAVDQQANVERQQGSGGSPAPGGGTAATAAAKTRAAVQAEVHQEHAARIATETDGSLVTWTEEVHEQVTAADAAFLAARDAHQKADAARAAAREAYRADQRSEGKSAEWHTRVAEAQQAHEALKEAREALYRLQALAELLSKELQRRRSIAAAAGMGASSRRRSSSEAGAAATAAGGSRAAGAGGGAAASRSVQQIEERLLAPPATQGTKRKRGAPPEPCPFCGHCYTVRDGLSNKVGESGARLHLRRCQCRKKTPPCKNCPECKRLPDVMQLCTGTDSAAAFELCQRQYGCAICACKCPGVGKWVENDEESRQAFKARTQKRLDEIVQMGWQDHTHTTSVAPTSTAGDCGTVSAGTATAAHSHSSGGEGQEVAGRARRAAQQAPARSGPPPRRLPADIRQELEAIQQRQQGQAAGQQGQSASCGMVLPPLPVQRKQQGAAAAAADAHHHPQQQQQPSSSRRTSHSRLQTAGRAGAGQHAHGQRHSHKHSHHHHHHDHDEHQGHEHHHTCSHPHEDCTSDCCSAPTVAPPPAGGIAGADPLLLAQQPGLAALAAALTSSGPGVPPSAAAAAAASLGPAASSDWLRLWEQCASSWAPSSAPAAPAPAAALPLLPPATGGAALPPLPSLPLPLVATRAPPELPAEVTALVQEVFSHAAGEEAAAAVLAFLRRQHLTSLCDFEFLEREMLERELGPAGLPPLLLNKFLQLGKRAAAAAAAAAAGASQAAAWATAAGAEGRNAAGAAAAAAAAAGTNDGGAALPSGTDGAAATQP